MGEQEVEVGTTTLLGFPAPAAGRGGTRPEPGEERGTSEVELEQSSLMVINVRRSQCNSRRKKRARDQVESGRKTQSNSCALRSSARVLVLTKTFVDQNLYYTGCVQISSMVSG